MGLLLRDVIFVAVGERKAAEIRAVSRSEAPSGVHEMARRLEKQLSIMPDHYQMARSCEL